MTFLIIGGLLIIAILAILGAIYLSVSDQRAQRAVKAQTNGVANSGSTSYSPVITQQPTENRQLEQSTTIRQGIPSPGEKSVHSTEINQQRYALDGQFHELTVELQTLYQYASELERRLHTLVEAADRIEKTHNSQVSTEEEIHAQPSADSNS